MLMNRRKFINYSSMGAAALSSRIISPMSEHPIQGENLNVFGPRSGYTPHLSAMVSMMNWMRRTVLMSLNGLTQKDLDYIHDEDSNSIGAMLWHLASTERFYQLNTFENRRWGDWPAGENEKWGIAMSLGARARAVIKDQPLEFYLEKLEEVRAYTLAELAKRDDDWLFYTDEDFGWGPTNNYCKWFHVVEHESNHNGQIKYLTKRIST